MVRFTLHPSKCSSLHVDIISFVITIHVYGSILRLVSYTLHLILFGLVVWFHILCCYVTWLLALLPISNPLISLALRSFKTVRS